MGTDIRSILRVGLLNKVCTADTAILVAADILKNDPGYIGNNVRPNQTGVAYYTVEIAPSVTGDLSVVITDGTDTSEVMLGSCAKDAVSKPVFFIKSSSSSTIDTAWKFNLKFSEDATLNLLCITEHGGSIA